MFLCDLTEGQRANRGTKRPSDLSKVTQLVGEEMRIVTMFPTTRVHSSGKTHGSSEDSIGNTLY